MTNQQYKPFIFIAVNDGIVYASIIMASYMTEAVMLFIVKYPCYEIAQVQAGNHLDLLGKGNPLEKLGVVVDGCDEMHSFIDSMLDGFISMVNASLIQAGEEG